VTSPADQPAGKKAAEAKFPQRVDVRIPADGLGRTLASMLDWCHETLALDGWDVHHHTESRDGHVRVEYVRFYFMSEADAEAFKLTIPGAQA
jgi:hypothetical protein